MTFSIEWLTLALITIINSVAACLIKLALNRFLAHFDTLVESVQRLTVCVARQTERWESPKSATVIVNGEAQ